jgi:hypothetical protein
MRPEPPGAVKARVLGRSNEHTGRRTWLSCMAVNSKKLVSRHFARSRIAGICCAIGCRSLRVRFKSIGCRSLVMFKYVRSGAVELPSFAVKRTNKVIEENSRNVKSGGLTKASDAKIRVNDDCNYVRGEGERDRM